LEFLLKISLAWQIVCLRCQGLFMQREREKDQLGLGLVRTLVRRPGRRRRMGITSSIHIGPYEIFYPLKPSVSSVQQYGQHNLPGRLFVVEGIDGSGKSTQLSLLHKWLDAKGYGVVFSEWNSSPLVKDTTRLGKKKKLLTPATFSLVHATDFADRTEHSILPFLKAGAIVLCDRYVYTAFARDAARGMDGDWVRDLYGFAVKPTAAFYFKVPLETAIGRLVGARDGFKYYEAGLDLGLTCDAEDSFRLFQGRILEEYEKMIPEFGLTVIDATQPVEAQQAQVRRIVQSHLANAKELRIQP
jgi:dTMP kinase